MSHRRLSSHPMRMMGVSAASRLSGLALLPLVIALLTACGPSQNPPANTAAGDNKAPAPPASAPAAPASAPAEAPAPAPVPVAAAAKTGEQVVQATCGVCHNAGVAGAPKIGDKAGWAPRLALGLDGLVNSVLKGKNAMPARGGNPALSDLEIARAVVFMANKSGGNLKEPDGKK